MQYKRAAAIVPCTYDLNPLMKSLNPFGNYFHHYVPITTAPCYSVASIRSIDRIAIEQYGLPLMQRAGEVSAYCMRELDAKARKFACIAGSGNNGGDVWVMAQCLHQAGYAVHVFALETHTVDAQKARQRAIAAGVRYEPLISMPHLEDYDWIIDGLIGSGLCATLKPQAIQLIEHINSSNKPILSLDIPSGLQAETGVAQPTAVVAHSTLSFVACSLGMFTADGSDYCGQLYYSDLGIDASVYQTHTPQCHPLVAPVVRKRPQNCHKKQLGPTWIMAGELSMLGATVLTAKAALRAGSGLCSIIGDAQLPMLLTTQIPDCIVHTDLPEETPQSISIGPGLECKATNIELFAHIAALQVPTVVDAGALHILAQYPQKRDNWVLTPHPGEAAALLNCCVADIQHNRLDAAAQIARQYGGVVLLKGCGTLIHDGTDCFLSTAGNAGMSSAGMGDVLTGVIAALLAQGYTPLEAAQLGQHLHSAAADSLFPTLGYSLTASDVADAIRLIPSQ